MVGYFKKKAQSAGAEHTFVAEPGEACVILCSIYSKKYV